MKKREKYFHAQKDRYLGIWLLKTSNSQIALTLNLHKAQKDSAWIALNKCANLHGHEDNLWSHISKQCYSVWSVPFLLPYMSRSSDGESRKKEVNDGEKVVETNKKIEI